MKSERAYPDVYDYLMRLGSDAARRDTILAFTPVLDASLAQLPLFSRLEPLDTFLHRHSATIISLHNSAIPLQGASGITALLLKEHSEFGPAVHAQVSPH